MDAMWIKLLSVFGLGLVGLWEGVPAGFALGLHPVLIGVLSGSASFLAALTVLLLGDRIRARLVKRRPPPEPGAYSRPPERLIDRIWRRYGVIGLGLLAPGLTGSHLGVALGLSLGVPARRLLVWLMGGIMLWTVALTLVGMLGTAGVMRLLGKH
jgi:hypothetical protein